MTLSLPEPPDTASVLPCLQFAADEANWPLAQDFDAFCIEIVRATNGIDSLRTHLMRYLSSKGIDVRELVYRPDIDGTGGPKLDALEVVRSCWMMGLTDEQTEIVSGFTPEQQHAAHQAGLLGLPRQPKVREILRLWALGYDVSSIARQVGVVPSYISKTFKRSRIERNAVNVHSEQHRHREKIIDLWNQGYTSAYIADVMEVSHGSVRNIISRARHQGIPVRSGRLPVEERAIQKFEGVSPFQREAQS